MFVFFTFLPLFLVQATVAASTTPANQVVVKWNNRVTGLRNSCPPADAHAVDIMLGRQLALVDLEGFDGSDHIPCASRACKGFLPFNKNRQQTDEKFLAEVKEELTTVCEDLLQELSTQILFNGPCHNALKAADCEVSFTLTTF